MSELAVKKLLGDRPWLIVSANAMALVFSIGILFVASNVGRPFPITLLVCMLGALLGWGLGILATPLSDPDKTRFSRIAQGLSAFASGYLVSKLDRFLEATLFSNAGAVIADSWVLLALFSASMLVTGIVVFLNRSYHHGATEI